ncbi:hypothetical protein BST61_g7605 [Cercospora zeina]
MKYSTGTAALLASLSATGALAAPVKDPKNYNPLSYVDPKNIEAAPITTPWSPSLWSELGYKVPVKARSILFGDEGPRYPEYFSRPYGEVPVKREAEAKSIYGDAPGIPELWWKPVGKTPLKREAEADPFLGDIVKLIGMVIDKATKRDAEAEADPIFASIKELVRKIIDKYVAKRDAEADAEAEADPFRETDEQLIGTVIGTIIDKAT